MEKIEIGVIGGSGLYEMEDLEVLEERRVDTPWGPPSDGLIIGRLEGRNVAFLPRHGRGHVHSPTSINYRANIDAMKRLGITDLVSVSACGSLREGMAPGDFVMVDQFIDRTVNRKKTFFGAGCVAHVSIAHPVCERLRKTLLAAGQKGEHRIHDGGTYITMEGPQFSTLAESRMYRHYWGADVIGMTNMPEAKLAREAELCYATVAMVTDYDSWHDEHGEIDITKVLMTMAANVAGARALVEEAIPGLGPDRAPCPHGCDRALEHAIITAEDKRDPDLLARLDAVAGRVLG